MNDAITRWLQLPLLAKVGTLAGCTLLLILLIGVLLIRPRQQAQQQLKQRQDALQQQAQLRQHQLAQYPMLSTLQQQLQQLQTRLTTPVSAPLTLETLLAERGQQLASWQPDTAPQQLALQLRWSEFQPLFSQLNRLHPTPQAARFLLQADNGRLLAQLWLEITDEE